MQPWMRRRMQRLTQRLTLWRMRRRTMRLMRSTRRPAMNDASAGAAVDAPPATATPMLDASASMLDASASTPDAGVLSPPPTGCRVAGDPSLLGWLAGAA